MPDHSVKVALQIGTPDAPVLQGFIQSNSRISMIMGPLGSGKTFGCGQRLLRHMVEQEANASGIRPTRMVIVRNTYTDLLSTAVKDWEGMAGHLGKMTRSTVEPPHFKMDVDLEDGTRVKGEIIFLALDRDEHVRKLRGTNYTGFWLNEIKELPKSIPDMVEYRTGRYPTMADGGVRPTWEGFIGDTNAPDEDHWYYKLAEERRPSGWEFFRQPGGVLDSGEKREDGRVVWIENPDAENAKNLPKDYYMRGIDSHEDDWISVNLANNYGFVIEGKPVHPQYNDLVHCSIDIILYDDRYPVILGFDFGRTPACLVVQYIEAVGRYVVIDEFLSEDMSASLFAPECKLWLDKEYPEASMTGWGDPAGDHAGQTVEITPIQMLRAAGIPCQPAPTNVELLRRAAIDKPLMRMCPSDMKPAFLISPKCKVTRKGLRGGFCYKRLQVSGERYADVPDKNMYSHPVEALEYALLGAGEGRAAIRQDSHIRNSRRPRQRIARMS